MNCTMDYEIFIRTAFGYTTNKGEIINRWDDPAGLATTDIFTLDNIFSVKAATSYCMEIFSHAIINKHGENINDAEHSRLKDFTKKILNAKDLDTICKLINEYNETVIKKYFDFNNGIINLR